MEVQKKPDEVAAPKDSAPLITWHVAYVAIENQTNLPLPFIAITHRPGEYDNRDTMYWVNVEASSTTTQTLEINFQTGFAADSDYWYVVFQWGGGIIWSSPTIAPKMCNYTSADKNGTGYIRIQGQEYNDPTVTIVPPVSSNCDIAVGATT